jgi:hypothetical protein
MITTLSMSRMNHKTRRRIPRLMTNTDHRHFCYLGTYLKILQKKTGKEGRRIRKQREKEEKKKRL